MESHEKPKEWKARLRHEFITYWITFTYLAIFFAVFAWHRRLIMAEDSIPITDYWMPLIEAAILAKVILIIDLFGAAHRFESRPLILPTLYKTAFFAVGIAVFTLLEATVRGLISNHDFSHGVRELLKENRIQLIATPLFKCFALVPFFAVREVGRVLKEGTLARMFFTRYRPAIQND